jgi:hypothetical protein
MLPSRLNRLAWSAFTLLGTAVRAVPLGVFTATLPGTWIDSPIEDAA